MALEGFLGWKAKPARLRALRPRAPKGLCDLINAMLAREPADRPPLPEALALMNGFITAGPRIWPHAPGERPAG